MTSNSTGSLALWLADHTDDIAHHEEAGEFVRDLKHLVDRMLRMVNRPIPPRFCGPCPQVLDDGTRCNTALLADRDAVEVACPYCKTLHDIDVIEQQLWSEIGEWLLRQDEIVAVMRHLGEPIGESTLRRWRSMGRLLPRGYRDGKPRFWVNDVRELRNA